MEQIASTYFIGAIFIDELQHLNAAKTGGKDNMLNFFVNLINTIGIRVVCGRASKCQARVWLGYL
ncbi:hypothetical protein [Janthinobacterium sp.]|uniref:hypothetical protein n=1 Tax=Janthinobacterium sp. TaxID=1871054 RepID=UPI0025BF5A28|nr:hypothetical protein [Janthinobacterium sp.]